MRYLSGYKVQVHVLAFSRVAPREDVFPGILNLFAGQTQRVRWGVGSDGYSMTRSLWAAEDRRFTMGGRSGVPLATYFFLLPAWASWVSNSCSV